MDKKLDIIKIADRLSSLDKQGILEFINSRNIKINGSSDGSRINLDTISKEQLDALHQYVDLLDSLAALKNQSHQI